MFCGHGKEPEHAKIPKKAHGKCASISWLDNSRVRCKAHHTAILCRDAESAGKIGIVHPSAMARKVLRGIKVLREWADTGRDSVEISRYTCRVLQELGLGRVCRRSKTVNPFGETHTGDLMGNCVSAMEPVVVLHDSSFFVDVM
jgi:hypothetical protein